MTTAEEIIKLREEAKIHHVLWSVSKILFVAEQQFKEQGILNTEIGQNSLEAIAAIGLPFYDPEMKFILPDKEHIKTFHRLMKKYQKKGFCPCPHCLFNHMSEVMEKSVVSSAQVPDCSFVEEENS